MRRTIVHGFGLAVAAAVTLALPAAAVDGKEVFLAQKCNMCHGVSTAGIEATTKSAKMKGPDLVGVVQAHEPSWIADLLHKKIDVNGKKHSKEFKGTDEELTALIDWLAAQKKG